MSDPTIDQAQIDALVQQKLKTEVEAAVRAAVADIKSKLDGAFTQRDEALRKVAELEEAKRIADQERLKAEGKQLEALQSQLDAANAKVNEITARLDVSHKRNVELTRDAEVRSAMSTLEFRSAKAGNIALQEIVSQLVVDDKGVWKHNSGKSIGEFVADFAADEEQAFLFKPKTNSGGGGGGSKEHKPAAKKALKDMTQAEVLQLAAEGKL